MLRLLNYCGRDAADAGDDAAAAAAIVVVARSLYTYRLILRHFLRSWFLQKQFPPKKSNRATRSPYPRATRAPSTPA